MTEGPRKDSEKKVETQSGKIGKYFRRAMVAGGILGGAALARQEYRSLESSDEQLQSQTVEAEADTTVEAPGAAAKIILHEWKKNHPEVKSIKLNPIEFSNHGGSAHAHVEVTLTDGRTISADGNGGLEGIPPLDDLVEKVYDKFGKQMLDEDNPIIVIDAINAALFNLEKSLGQKTQ